MAVTRTTALRWLGGLVMTAIAIASFAVAYDVPLLVRNGALPTVRPAQLVFLLEVGLFFLGLIVIGLAITGRWAGVLIDSRNRFSLSQLNAALWTGLLIAGLFATAIVNLADREARPFDIAVPLQVFAAAGIAATTLAATPIVRATKRGDGTARPVPMRAGVAVPDVRVIGRIVENVDARRARWADLFEGEETGNFERPDLGRIQLFYFNMLALGAYAVLLYLRLAGPTPFAFPDLDSGLVGLLALSNGTAIVYQAAPHSA